MSMKRGSWRSSVRAQTGLPAAENRGACGVPSEIPDGEVGCSANRSRIGEVNLEDADHFLASTNIFSLAQELGFWKPGTPFVWHQVYGGPGSKQNSLREWRVLSLAAPSLALKATGDPAVDRYPFSVKPDKPITVPALIDVMRDAYEGTPFDLTEQPAFQVQGQKSPLARPWGPPELFDLLQIQPERTICTPTSGYVFIAQLRDWLPDPVGNCLWFAYGPANTSCFVPVYAGVTDLPDTWDQPANFTRMDREQPQWNFRLVHNLANSFRYQDAMKDIQRVIDPAEQRYFGIQKEIDQAAGSVFEKHGAVGVETFLTDYAQQCTTHVGNTYRELVEYLMFEYLLDDEILAPSRPPQIPVPAIPDATEVQHVE